jgi:protocatechuate 3,4-dioxygenase beta subunit
MLVSSRALPQQSQQQTPTGVIEGTVVRSDSGEPINGVQVTLTFVNIAPVGAPAGTVAAAPAQLPQPSNATTGADGKFSFKNLRAGSYQIAAVVNGFVRTEYGQRSPNARGRPVFLSEGQTFRDAALRMTPTGTISGRVFDQNGQPATDAPVQLLRAAYNGVSRSYQSVAQGSADDRGDYRMYGVPPGRYYLLAGNLPGPTRLAGGGLGLPSATSQRYSVVFHPSVSAIEQASTIEVKPGAEAAFDFRLQRLGSGYRVKGRVIDATGAGLPANTNITVGYRTLGGGGGSFSNGRNFDPAAGTFELQNIPPGDYTLQVQIPETNPTTILGGPTAQIDILARQVAQAARPAGTAPIQVVDRDIEGVVITVSTGVTVSGRLILEGQPLSAIPNLQQMALAFQSVAGLSVGPNPVGTPVAADGTFQVVGLREGEYRVSALRLLVPSSGLYLKSVRYGGDDVLSKPLRFSGAGSGEFEVVLRSGVGQIAGNVTDARLQAAAGVQVFAIPTDRGRVNDYKQAMTDQNGRYSLTGVTPGDYQVFSWESIENQAHYDPDFLKQYEQQGKIVHVAESSSQNVDLRMIPAP